MPNRTKNFFCVDCGKPARFIESTEANGVDEYKDVVTCDNGCENIMYVVRRIDDHGPPITENDQEDETPAPKKKKS